MLSANWFFKSKTVPDMAPSYNFDANASYIIAGGLGGLGQSMARWMAGRGAKNLILLSRSTSHSEASMSLLKELRVKGIKVVTPPCDISDALVLASVLTDCKNTMPPIKGCIQSSMVMKVSIISREL